MTYIRKLYARYQGYYTTHPLRTMMIWSFLIPIIILFLYYIAQGIFPFGNSTILTVDLGQQYIDFYQYYRETLMGEWDGLAYSFEKAIGGEMMGTWSYYLLSPFLPIILLFPQAWLTFAVAVVVLLKIGTAGLAFQYLLGKVYKEANWRTLTFAVSYALIAYTSVNQLNIMWLDGVAFLPFVIWGIEKINRGGSFLTFSAWLAIILMANYYIGYMICIFVVLYYLYSTVKASSDWQVRKTTDLSEKMHFQWQKLWHSISRFTLGALIAGALAAVVLIPTYFALSGSKGAYTDPVFEWAFAYPIQDVISKFVIGAFNFDQMPDGLPNIFIGTLGLITAILYFFQKKFPKRERIMALLILVFLFLSMNVKALNMMWHAFQYPIWYPYRYSFVVSFFLLFIGYRAYRKLGSISLKTAIGLLVIAALSSIYLLWHLAEFDYLSSWQIWVSLLVFIGFSLLLLLIDDYRKIIFPIIAILTFIEMGTNSVLNLSSLNYLKNDEFTEYISTSSPIIDKYRPAEDEFYRMTKTFQRTKNDAMQLNYFDLNHFNSTLEKNTTQFFDKLGQPTSDGFVNYTTGTLLTDALFGVEYYIDTLPQSDEEIENGAYNRNPTTQRADLIQYPVVETTEDFVVHKNPYALPLGFMVPTAISQIDFNDKSPIILQDDLLNVLTGNVDETNDYLTTYFEIANFKRLELFDVKSDTENEVNANYQRTSESEDGYIDITIEIKSNDAYYLTIPSHITDENAELYLDGERLNYDSSFRNTQVYNIANEEAGSEKIFSIKLLEDDLSLSDVNVYTLNNQAVFDVIEDLSTQGLNITEFSNNHIVGDVNATQADQMMLLSIPFSEGWQATLDGEPAEIFPILDGGLSAISIPNEGSYNIDLRYRMPGAKVGVSVSAVTLVLCVGLAYYHKRKR